MGRQDLAVRVGLDRVGPEGRAADDRGGGEKIRRGKEPPEQCLQAELTRRLEAGAEGAGKTTTLKASSNLLRAERGEVTKGSITFVGERIDRLDAADVVRRGLIQVMEGRHCFAHLTVEENLLTGAYTRRDGRSAIAADLDQVYVYFPRLKARRRA